MREAIATLKPVPERISLTGRGLAWRSRLRLVAIGFFAAACAALMPDMAHAGIITGFTTGPQSQVSDGFEVSLNDDDPGANAPAPATPQERSAPGNHDVPQVEPGLDLVGGGTTSAPVTSGGPVAPAILAAAALEVAASDAVRRIWLMQDLAVDSPVPLGLLDPPKA
jgi:hypothetical protein